MDLRNLLGKLTLIEGTMASAEKHATGPKFTGKWKGTDAGTPGNKMVGGMEESLLKDLNKGPRAKTKAEELAEEYQAFLEAEFKDTEDRRPGRKSDRPSRDYGKTGEQSKRYHYQKTDESGMSGKDIELQDYRSMTDKEFKNAYNTSKAEWMNKNKSLVITNPKIKKGLGLKEGWGQGTDRVRLPDEPALYYSSKGPLSKEYNELYKQLVPDQGAADTIEGEVLRAASKIVYRHYNDGDEFNQASFDQLEKYIGKVTSYDDLAHKATEFALKANGNYHPNTGWDSLDVMEYGPEDYDDDYEEDDSDWYDDDDDLEEGWESGPEEYEEPYDDADDAYDRQRQEKIDTDAEREWAKLPKTTTYKLLGRGPNMEPNYDFGGTEYDSQEAAIQARAKLMADPKTPHPEHIGIQTITRVKDQTDEAVDGGGHIKDMDDYIEKRDAIYQALADGKQKDNYDWWKQRLFDLNRMAKAQGIKIEESRAHKQLDTWFKNRERLEKFARGEVTIPTPQERRAELAKQKPKKKVTELSATPATPSIKPVYPQSAGATSPPNVNSLNTQQKKDLAAKTDPDAEKKVVAAVTSLKSATGSTATADTLLKALQSADQGKSTDAKTMTTLKPVMDVVAKAGTTAKLAGQLKSLIDQTKNSN